MALGAVQLNIARADIPRYCALLNIRIRAHYAMPNMLGAMMHGDYISKHTLTYSFRM